MCYARRQRSSWARIKLSNNLYHIYLLGSYNLFFELFFLSFFYFVEYITLWRDLVFRTSQCFVQSLLLFNFQWPFAAFFCDSLNIIPPSFSLVNTFFEIFSPFFKKFFRLVWARYNSRPPLIFAARILYLFSFTLSIPFGKFFLKIFCWLFFIL